MVGVSNPMVDAPEAGPQRPASGAELRAAAPATADGARAAEGFASFPSAAHLIAAALPHAGTFDAGAPAVIWSLST